MPLTARWGLRERHHQSNFIPPSRAPVEKIDHVPGVEERVPKRALEDFERLEGRETLRVAEADPEVLGERHVIEPKVGKSWCEWQDFNEVDELWDF